MPLYFIASRFTQQCSVVVKHEPMPQHPLTPLLEGPWNLYLYFVRYKKHRAKVCKVKVLTLCHIRDLPKYRFDQIREFNYFGAKHKFFILGLHELKVPQCV